MFVQNLLKQSGLCVHRLLEHLGIRILSLGVLFLMVLSADSNYFPESNVHCNPDTVCSL